MTTTIILSDIHLGSRNCHPLQVSQILQTSFDRLILNGDTLNNLNLKKLKPKHWMVLGQLREIARKRELILIRGNHDGGALPELPFGPLDVLATLLGVELCEEYVLDTERGPYVVLHGDRFDPTLHWPILTDAADWCYQTTQKVNKRAARWLKQKVKRLGGAVEFIKQKAVAYARARGCKGVVTGHTHYSDDEWVGDIHFLNTGCWVDKPCTYVMARDGHVRLCQWHKTNAVALADTGLGERPPDFSIRPHLRVEPTQAVQQGLG
jgi:UDP-2,3-diacylglucosamine pyrophosphatase LpxH